MQRANEGTGAARRVLTAGMSFALCSALVVGYVPVVASADVRDGQEQQAVDVQKSGLVKEAGHWRFYRKSGKLLTSSWKKVNGRRYYFGKNGNATVGAAKIGGKRYVFDARGRLLQPAKTKVVRSADKLYYVTPKGRPGASGWLLKRGKFRYVRKTGQLVTGGSVDGIRFGEDGYSKDDHASRLKLATIKRIDALANSSMSRRTKLKRCFSWLWQRPFVNSTTPKDIGKRGWAQRCAMRVLRTGNIECWGHACTFAMMAYELGCEPRVVGRKGVHAYVMIGDERWDNMAAKPHISGTSTWKIVSWRDTSPKVWGVYAERAAENAKAKKAEAARKAAASAGFKTVKGKLRYYKAGKPLKKQWLTVKGKTYYFDKKGNAVTGSVKVKAGRKGHANCYWVFGRKHALLTGEKTRDVKVAGISYRVRKDGRAFTGWTSDKTRFHLENGELATGVRLVSGKLEAFDETGTYDSPLSASLQAASVLNADPTGLLSLLGEAESVTSSPNSCYGVATVPGSDVAYRYAHVTVNVFEGEDGTRLLESVV